ncbi:MAG: hypothetical protein ABIO71_11880 [Caldimonas sp.]
MGLLGMALGGAGAAAGDLSNKYLDAQFANQRAQVLADISRDSAMKMDQYQNSAGRRATLRGEEALDAGSKAAQARADELARFNDTPLIDAGAAAANRASEATRATRTADAVAAEDAKLRSVNPGDKVMRGAGENTNPTAAELNLRALREGLKGKTGEERDRAMEAAVKSVAERLKDLDKAMIDGVKEGTLSPSAPKPETGFFGGAKDPKPNPAFDNYQQLLRQKRQLEKQQTDLMQEWRGGAVAPGAAGASFTSGDFLGARAGSTLKAGPAEAGMRNAAMLSPEEQARSDKFEASPQNIALLNEAIRTAKNPDHRALLEKELARLTAPVAQPTSLIAAGAATAPPAKKPPEEPAKPQRTVAQAVADESPAQARARVRAREDELRVQRDTESKQADQSRQAIQANFDRDMATMGVAEFVKKYDERRVDLTDAQRVILAKAYRKL